MAAVELILGTVPVAQWAKPLTAFIPSLMNGSI